MQLNSAVLVFPQVVSLTVMSVLPVGEAELTEGCSLSHLVGLGFS